MSSEPKQIIILRKDLNMRKGKMVAQGAHASTAAFLNGGVVNQTTGEYTFSLTNEVALAWICGGHAKICVGVNNEEELVKLYELAVAQNLPCAIITDSGRTEFNGVPTKTAVAIGPALPEQLNPITGQLSLL